MVAHEPTVVTTEGTYESLDSGPISVEHVLSLPEYLETMPSGALDRLHDNPSTCLGVLRGLPDLARMYVMRLLPLSKPLPVDVVRMWLKPGDAADLQHERTLQTLYRRRVCQKGEPESHGGQQIDTIMLCKNFAKNLSVALNGGGQPWTSAKEIEPEKEQYQKTTDQLQAIARERWDAVLRYTVNPNQALITDTARAVLASAGYLTETPDGTISITKKGFHFVLMDWHGQVWAFMKCYLEMIQRDPDFESFNLVETIAFLFQLSFSKFGRAYPFDVLSETQQGVVQHLREFGLVYKRNKKSNWYYPTKIAIELAAGGASGGTDAGLGGMDSADAQTLDVSGGKGYLLVETNYIVYAYTTSPLNISLLHLFVELECRFPNMVRGRITRDSCNRAFRKGITAEQILHFLRSNAHPRMKAKAMGHNFADASLGGLDVMAGDEGRPKKPILPETVSDQIRLWEREKFLLVFNQAYFYENFANYADFQAMVDHSKIIGCHLWHSDAKRILSVDQDRHAEMKRFWKDYRKRCQGNLVREEGED
eukprot:Clim_evm42s88 gene=Clim_evmTU42s88